MIVIYRPWLTRLTVFVVAVLTLGLVRLDRPRVGRLPTIGLLRRWLISLESRYRGGRDGRLGIPRAEDKAPPPSIWKLKQQGDAAVRDLAASWAATRARLQGEQEAIKRSREAAEARIKALTISLAEPCKRRDDRLATLATMKQQEEGRLAEDRWRITRWPYRLALLTIFGGEFPLNAVAFNLFGEERTLTWAMTAGLAAVLVFCAHSLGVLWRQRAMSDRDMVVTGLLTVLPVFVITGIAVVRENYLENINADTGLAVLSPAAGIAIFLIMNLVIYLGAFALSYLHHDPTGEMLERHEAEVRRAERAVRRHQRKIDRVENVKAWLTAKLELWVGAEREAHDSAEYQVRRHKDFFEAFMEVYWASNRLAIERRLKRIGTRARRRGEDVDPAALKWTAPRFEKSPEIVLPAALTSASKRQQREKRALDETLTSEAAATVPKPAAEGV